MLTLLLTKQSFSMSRDNTNYSEVEQCSSAVRVTYRSTHQLSRKYLPSQLSCANIKAKSGWLSCDKKETHRIASLLKGTQKILT